MLCLYCKSNLSEGPNLFSLKKWLEKALWQRPCLLSCEFVQSAAALFGNQACKHHIPLACTAVSIQVLFHSDFDPFHLLNDEWAQSQLEKAWPWMQLCRRKLLSTAWQLRMHSCRQRREEYALGQRNKTEKWEENRNHSESLVSLDDSLSFCHSASSPTGLLWRESPSHRHDLRKLVKAGCTPGSGGPQSIDCGPLESLSLSRKLAWTHRSAQKPH